MVKRCIRCLKIKNVGDFYFHNVLKKEYTCYCKECDKSRVKKYSEKNCIVCGITHNNRGKCCSESCVKLSLRKKRPFKKRCGQTGGYVSVTLNEKYKLLGNSYSYNSVHNWMYKNYGNPIECDDCGKTGLKQSGQWNIHWANISDTYLMERSDWKQLCRKCHKKFDKEKRLNNSHFGILGGNYKSPCSNSCATQQ